MAFSREAWPVVALNAAGVFFILLGLMTLALPVAQQGPFMLQIVNHYAIHLMDMAGIFALGMGITLTWLGGQLWKRQLQI